MAKSNTTPLLQTTLSLLAFTTLFLLVNSADFIDFTFDEFTSASETDLIFQGDAKISASKTLQLTKTNTSNGNPLKNSVGRVLYSAPVHLWESGTTNVSTFETTFKFVVKSTTREIAGDGFTFFFAPINSTIPPDSDGGFFGLFSNTTSQSDAAKQILAVEFDTYIDSRWDPNYRHIGIDVHSIRSQAQTIWDRKNGSEVTTKINYNTNNKILYVVSSYSTGEQYYLSASIDLPSILPEWVRVGFSAATGDSAVETHELTSWTYSSWLHPVSLARKGNKRSARYV